MSHEARFAELGLELPPAPKPVGVYKPIVTVGNLAYLSGHGPLQTDGTLIVGCIGQDLDQQAGYEAAQQTGLALIATLRSALGSLDRVQRVVKLFGLVNCVAEFDQHPAVINGCSELGRQELNGARDAGLRISAVARVDQLNVRLA